MKKSNTSALTDLIKAMQEKALEANDLEIIRRMQTMPTPGKRLKRSAIRDLIKNPTKVDFQEIPENYSQYVRHYLYMVKRESKKAG